MVTGQERPAGTEGVAVDTVEVQGTVEPGWEGVRDAFVRNFAERGERGASVAVYRDGRPVVDLWGGSRDADGSEPWGRDDVHLIRSATKGVAAAVPLLLHQRGQLDLDAPVGTYWPEYKAAGKEHTRVRHLLAHRAGVPVLDVPVPFEDPAAGPRAVAAQAPVWEPGTDHGYHPHTYGWLVGELVRRVTGRTLGQWLAEQITRPRGIDLWIGLPDAEQHRAGTVTRVEPPAVGNGLRLRPKQAVADAYANPDSLTRRAFASLADTDENTPAYRAAELPATNGMANARALAAFYASLIGPVDGHARLFAPATVALARTEESAGPDRTLVVNTRFGPGYMLHGPASPLLGPSSFGHPGRGGPLGFADPDSGIAFGYTTNGLQKGVTADPRAQALVRAVRAAAG
ncbi:beta-lactamase family protein [Streptomyces sp. TRM66268-LWL]|uniref:Beta-lactamase family protein n=1 Tax=Streptomyces polyasparticus TaxID=2767826 RepID=A0ABR7SMW8_9ACTN|nr:serine hydrolase domain-containing protein [Streptomyces polyasparticus]MBC9716825.1 beta-lactamase family protein [Streptomyces polyasparticus]